MEQLNTFLRKHKLNPCKLAKLMGVSPSTVHRHLKRRRKMSFDTALKYRKAGIPWKAIQDLMEGK